MQIIILAGGKGTRLKSETGDTPKVMADINNRPFLDYILDDILKYDIDKVILAVGYNKEYIKYYYNDSYKGLKLEYSEENSPLGTGGAIKKALTLCDDDSCFIVNGDIYHTINYNDMFDQYKKANVDVYLALKNMKNIERFGTVEVKNNKIIKFNEKKKVDEGLINVGCYIFKKDILNDYPDIFSIEEDFFNKNINNLKNSYYLYDGYFTDIGIPEDYHKFIDIQNKKGL